MCLWGLGYAAIIMNYERSRVREISCVVVSDILLVQSNHKKLICETHHATSWRLAPGV